MEHKNIPNDGLHEPKDIVFAVAGQVYIADGAGSGSWGQPPAPGIGGAQSGQVYVANGAGGGNWEYPTGGWAIYDDTGLAVTVTTSEVSVEIDGDGPLTVISQLPHSTGALWEDDHFLPVSFEDVYGIEFEFNISAVSGASNITVKLGDEVRQVEAATGIKKLSYPLHIFQGVPEDVVEILVSTDAGSVTVTNRRVKIVQLYGA